MIGVQIPKAEAMPKPVKANPQSPSSSTDTSYGSSFKDLVKDAKDAIDNNQKPISGEQDGKDLSEDGLEDALKQALMQNQLAQGEAVTVTDTAPKVAVNLLPVESAEGQGKTAAVANLTNVPTGLDVEGNAVISENLSSQKMPVTESNVIPDTQKSGEQQAVAQNAKIPVENSESVQKNQEIGTTQNNGKVQQTNQTEPAKDGKVATVLKAEVKQVSEQANNKPTVSEVSTEKQSLEQSGKTVTQTNQKGLQDSTLKQQGQQETTGTKVKTEVEEVKQADVNVVARAEKLDPAKVNIKVAEPYTANTESKMFTKQMADKIIFSSTDGSREIEIQLMPKDLGKVTIKLIFEGNSTLVQMTAQNAKAQNILNLNADSIKQIVETNTNTNVVVKVDDENKLNQQNQPFDGRGERQQKEKEEKRDNETLDPDSQIAFVNQLRLGLIEKSAS